MNRQHCAMALVTLLLGGTLAASRHIGQRFPGHLATPLQQISTGIAGWQSVRDKKLDDSSLVMLQASEYLSRIYAKDGAQLELFVAYYAQQRAGESMHSPKNCLPGSGWEIWRPGSTEFELDGERIRVNAYGIDNAGIRNVMLYWYQSADRIVSSEYLAKLLLARDTVFTGRTDGSIVRITLPDRPGAREEGTAFAMAVIPEVRRCLGHTH